MKKQQYQLNTEQIKKQLDAYDWSQIDHKIPDIPTALYTFQPSNPQTKLYYRRLLYFLNHYQQSHKQKAYSLSKYLLCLNKNNYYAMMVRNQSRKQLSKSITEQQELMKEILGQLQFTNALLLKNTKEYQVWNYKKDIISDCMAKINEKSKKQIKRNEDQFIFHIMTTQEEQKNYHAWDYMTWLSRTIGNLEQQIKHTQNMIFVSTKSQNQEYQCESLWKDCYSCWSYRFNLIKDLPIEKKVIYIKEDCQRVHNFVLKNPQNQCGWNYLTGLLQSNDINFDSKSLVINHIYEVCKQVKGDNRFAWTFLLQLGSKQVKMEALQKLIKIDPIRKLYYQFLKENEQNI